MSVVYKYGPLNPGENYIEMPRFAELLRVAAQGQDPMLWARVDTARPRVKRKLLVVATGEPFDDNVVGARGPHAAGLTAPSKYVGTFTLHAGTLVFHVFDFGAQPL